MADNESPILPSTKVAELLDRYSEVEELLIGLAPPFRKLKNPILRMSVAKVASLEQAAVAGHVPVLELVNRLRAAVGQANLPSEEETRVVASYFSSRPEWFDPSKITASIDERAGNPEPMAVTVVLQAAARLQPMEIVELITTFLPAPGIDILKKKGFDGLVHAG